jgi:hypothetical protein
MIQELLARQLSPHTHTASLTARLQSSECVLQRFNRVHELQGHSGCVNSVLFSEDGALAITGEQ